MLPKLTNEEFYAHYLTSNDFTNLDLRNITVMPGMLFEGVDFSGSLLTGVNMRNCTFRRCVFNQAEMEGADLTGVNMRNCTFRRCVFNRAEMEGADLAGAFFFDCKFVGTFMAGANLTDTTFSYCDLMVNAGAVNASNTMFNGGRIRGTDFSASNFTNTKIHDVNLESSQFDSSVFKDASIRRVNFLGSVLNGVNFSDVASLEECIGDGQYMKSIQIFPFPVVYTKDVIQIGKHCYSVGVWKEFDDMDTWGKGGFTLDSWAYLEKKRRTIDPTILYRLPEILNLVTKFPAE